MKGYLKKRSMYDASEPRNRRSATIITFKSPEWPKSPPPPPEIEHEGVETQSSKAISAATRRRGNADARGVISGAGLSMAKKREGFAMDAESSSAAKI